MCSCLKKSHYSLTLLWSGPFFICFSSMLISTASIVVNRMRKRKKVIMTLPEFRSLTAAHVGSMS